MKQNIFATALSAVTLFSTLSFIACSKDDTDTSKDMEKPTIVSDGSFNPINCQVYHAGDTIAFRAVFTDNAELGKFTLEVHNNFDHHSHSTEADHDHEEGGECGGEHEHEEAHDGESPWVYNQTFDIPAGQTRFEAKVDIAIPEDVAEGDYHFMVRLTDKAGWMQLKSVSLRIEDGHDPLDPS